MLTLTKDFIQIGASPQTKTEAIQLAGELLVKNHAVDPDYIASMLEREATVSTYMGNFIAIPHGTDASKQSIKKTAISVVTIPEGVDFGANPDENKVFILFGIAGVGDEHLDLLSAIAIFCSDVANVQKLIEAENPETIIRLLAEAE